MNNNNNFNAIISTAVRTNNLIAQNSTINNLNVSESTIHTLDVDTLNISDKINGNITISGNIEVDNLLVSNNLNIIGNTFLNNLDVSGNTNFSILPTYSGNLLPENNNELITKEYADLIRFIYFQQPVKTVSNTNINIDEPPSSIEGFTLSDGNRILLTNQVV